MESGLPVWVPANGKMLEAAKRVPLDVQATFESMFKASAKTSVAIINELGEESRLRNSETLDLATALDKVSLLSGELGRYIQQCNNAREAADADAIAADTGSEETFDAEVE